MKNFFQYFTKPPHEKQAAEFFASVLARETRARLGFASLAPCVFAQPRRSCRMVSCRACSSPAHQPASRHSIKPFSIKPIIANIRHSAGFRSHDVRRRRDECHIRHSAVSTSRYRLAIWDGCSSNVCYDGYSYRTRVKLEGHCKSHSDTSCAARPLTPSPRAGRLFAACRATGTGGESKRKWSE